MKTAVQRVILASLAVTVMLTEVLLVECSELVPPDGNYTACQGDNVTLSCSIDDQVTRVAWLNRSNILYAGNDKWSIDPRVRLLNYNKTEFSIMITSLDVADEGLYTCSYQTQDKPHTTQAYLIVQVPAKIVNISSSLTVNEGSNVNLMCLAVGKPEPTVTWRQLRDGFSSEGELLEIYEINRQQAGEYECITSNGVSIPDSKKVLITVNYPPLITDVKHAQSTIGRSAMLRCQAMAEPAAEFEWFKDDKRVTQGMEGVKIQTERTWSVLLFSNVTSKNYANYTCLVSNKLGSYNRSVQLLKPGTFPNHSVSYSVSPLLLAVWSFTLLALLRMI
ncbi:igLON family member 5 isoform X2 [Hyperolius riggenbachi]|uniref:igLON family member 5 isoform X2 n=1 Tax=Hyperolius riggenbachi TaxID=752182 RepID=UPI0035A28F8B